MTDRGRHHLNQREKRALVRILSAAALSALLFFFFAPHCGLRAYWLIQEKNEKLAQDNSGLAQENMRLKKEISRIQHDDRYLEQIAREKYNMLRKNEEVYYIAPPPAEEQDHASP
jgi:cell division protein FtsB